MWVITSPMGFRPPPIVSVPYFVFASCGIAYQLGKSDEKGRKSFNDNFFLRSSPEKDERILWDIRARAGGNMEFRPSILDTVHLSREARQELHAERKSERERKRASNGIVRLGLVDATLLTPSF